jgi:photosystem II stability/assembly factor-like uncharacterized protein
MRLLLISLLTATALAQSAPKVLFSNTTESLRGVSAVSKKIAWASGTHGAYLRTTDGSTWVPEKVTGAETLDFRGVVAFSADEAFLMSAGPGDQSRIYYTSDAGRHWQLQFTNTNPKGFFDSIVFWDRTHGIVLGDPIPDETGKLKFELLMTEDGQTWHSMPNAKLPAAVAGEGAFAASNSCVAILSSNWDGKGTTFSRAVSTSSKDGASAPDANIWFATGGKIARVFHSDDRGQTWQVFDTPIAHGPDSAGIFSIAFLDATHGVIAGGDYKHPDDDGPDLAFTNDGGKTWTLSPIRPQAYFSAVAYDRRSQAPKDDRKNLNENEIKSRLLIAAPKFIFDFRPPRNPSRISPGKKYHLEFNAISPYPSGGAVVVGPKGSMATIP